MPVVDSFELADTPIRERKRRPSHQLLHCARRENFACAGFPGDSSGGVDGNSNELAVCLFAFAGVKTGANLDT